MTKKEDRDLAKRIQDATEDYFGDMKKFMARGESTDERTFQPDLGHLLREIGEAISDSFLCLPEGKNDGAGHPDFILLEEDQPDGELPKYGVVEVKKISLDISDPFAGEHAEQMLGYLDRYTLLTVCNFREFRLFEKTKSGSPRLLEELVIADSKEAFRQIAENPARAARVHGASIWEFLRRTMHYKSRIVRPDDVAWFLASYAREALANIKSAASNGKGNPLRQLKKAMEDALGNPFMGRDQNDRDHMFFSTIAQTLFYGMFSAWVEHARIGRKGDFNWRSTPEAISVPVMQTLFNHLIDPVKLEELNLKSVIVRAENALNRIDKTQFLKEFESEKAIQHFYQPFLKEFDAVSQIELGVFYTPPEIVKFQVERVDRVLREELGIRDGLADEDVYILDPCCGTGAYVIEVLRKIRETLQARQNDGLVGNDVKKAAMERVMGFEVMPAPFLVAHWRVNEYLKRIGASPMSKKKRERVKIILANALPGWDEKSALDDMFFDISLEHDLAMLVKHDTRIQVVIGNPPYNAYAGAAPIEEGNLTEPYEKRATEIAKVGRVNMHDLYVRFFRIAEKRIQEARCGVVSYITSNSWITGKSFAGMRNHFLEIFDRAWVEDMKGSVFKIKGFSDGIEQAVATCLLVKKEIEGGGVLCTVSKRF